MTPLLRPSRLPVRSRPSRWWTIPAGLFIGSGLYGVIFGPFGSGVMLVAIGVGIAALNGGGGR